MAYIKWSNYDINNLPILPKWYWCRSGQSDIKGIIHYMMKIPEYKQQEVASEYERIFRSTKTGARKEANNYLKRQVNKY